MILLFCFLIPILYVLIKLIICFIVWKFGRISFDGFSAAGFSYDSKKDIFYSTRNAWQKNFGYTHLYDVSAPLFQMIIDTEPVRFYYDNRNWLITFWKGQYGIVTGAEVGIYYTNEKEVNKKTVYLPVPDNEMLPISLVLYKKKEIIAKVKAKHWWLAIFKLGMFSKPKELSLDIAIEFPNEKMFSAFLNAFMKLGYKAKDFKLNNTTFYFQYKKPKTRKVWTRSFIVDGIRQFFNHQNVKLYNRMLADMIDTNKINSSHNKKERRIYVSKFIPDVLRNKKEKKVKADSRNIVYLNSNVYSTINEANNEKEIKETI